MLLKLYFGISQNTQRYLPIPRLDVSIYSGVVFVSPSKAISVYESGSLAKNNINFPVQKEFGKSPNLGFEIFYPSSDKLHIGFNLDYLNSSAFARYQDFYGSYDLEASVFNLTYQFIPRFILINKTKSSWYIQGGVGGSLASEELTEYFSISSTISTPTYRENYEINQSRTLYGFMFSAKTGFVHYINRFSLQASLGYRSSFNFGDSNSIIRGFVTDLAFGFNLLNY